MAKKRTRTLDGLDIPDFLKRTEIDRELTNRIIRQDEHREWIMPGNSVTGEPKMAKQKQIEIECNDAELPVQVSILLADGKTTVTKDFGDMAEFGTFFDPKLHEVEGSTADPHETLIMLKEKVAKVAKVKVEPKAPEPVVEKPAAKEKKAKAAPPPPVSRGAVIKENIKPAKVAKAPRIKGKQVEASEMATKVAKAKPVAKAKKKAKGGTIVRHGCKVNGVQYKSAWEAFQKLKLGGVSECIKFRTILKASKSGKETFEKGGKKYPFVRTEG